MRRNAPAFTLIELLVVISIIGVLLAVFIPQIPAAMNWYKTNLSYAQLKSLGMAVEEYKLTYGYYPSDVMYWDGKNAIEGDYLSSHGYRSLCLMLQGPNGTGWGPTPSEPDIREFGPLPASPGYITSDDNGRKYFHCPFDRPVLYYRAYMDLYEDISYDQPPIDGTNTFRWKNTRYLYLVNFHAWEGQRGANEAPAGTAKMNRDMAVKHWMPTLTMSMSGRNRMPYNPTSFVLWMCGADKRFGYWMWDENYDGYVVDPGPENPNDGVYGRSDDITSFSKS